MADVALSENGNVLGVCRQQRFQIAVLVCGNALAAGGTERHQIGVFQLHAADALEKLHLRRVGKGVARLDKVYAQPVQRFDDFYFIVYGKGNVRALCAVAQGGIKNL